MTRWFHRLRPILVVLTGVVTLLLPLRAEAATSAEALFRQQPTTIEQGQVVEDAVVVGHDVTVDGEVSEVLLVINGDVHLSKNSRSGIVIDIGGVIRQDQGAHVNAVYHASLDTPFWNGALFGGTFMILIWFLMLAVSIGLVIVAILIGFAFRRQAETHLRYLDRSVRRVGMTGVFVSLAAAAISALLGVTVIGLPLAVFLVALYLCLGIIGFSIVSLWVGRLVQRNPSSSRPVWISSLIGASTIVAFSNIPFVGLLLFAILWLVGVGTATSWMADLWRRRTRKKKHSPDSI